MESPVDPFNRPRHRGDFALRVPPSRRALREFFAAWRAELPSARKELVACRDYAMAKITYISGVRAAELCGMRIKDLHWESGQFGRFLVRGRGRAGRGRGCGRRSCSPRAGSCCGGMWRRSGAGSPMIPSIPRRRCGPWSGWRETSRRWMRRLPRR